MKLIFGMSGTEGLQLWELCPQGTDIAINEQVSHFWALWQADPSEDTLPEEDARLFVDALLGLRSLLDWRQELLEKLLTYEGA